MYIYIYIHLRYIYSKKCNSHTYTYYIYIVPPRPCLKKAYLTLQPWEMTRQDMTNHPSIDLWLDFHPCALSYQNMNAVMIKTLSCAIEHERRVSKSTLEFGNTCVMCGLSSLPFYQKLGVPLILFVNGL